MSTNRILSKTRFIAGLQCPRQLWWKVNEPGAPELVLDRVSLSRLDSGNRVGALARTYVPGGVLITGERFEQEKKCALTATAISDGVDVLYEAAFMADGIFAAVDILVREGEGWIIKEVKSTTSVKKEHETDVAIQLMVLRQAGLNVSRIEIMHLNSGCRYPDLSNLFMTSDVTAQAEQLIPALQLSSVELIETMGGDYPDAAIGARCDSPRACPFKKRCWGELPEHHISTLYRIKKAKVETFMADGIETVVQIPDDTKLSVVANRQVDSVASNKLVVESGLGVELSSWKLPMAFLDFETINPAIPVWDNCGPYQQLPVQFSCHVMGVDGAVALHEWLAEREVDPGSALSAALVHACAGANTVIAYNMSFEKRCIDDLAEINPGLQEELLTISSRLVDLLPVVRNHVYHPRFHGSFSIKSVLPALMPDLGYSDLEIASGDVASLELEELILGDSDIDFDALRRNLLAYCKMDTYAMVALYECLENLAGEGIV